MRSGRWERHLDKARIQIDGRNFCEHHREIFLFLPELTKGRGDVGGCENCGRYLVEKRLKDVMIAPIDQNDLRIAPSQRPCRGDPAKAATNDDDALLPP